MAAVALDADVIIGFLDPEDAQHERAVAALRPWLAREHARLVAATVLSEVLVRPLRTGAVDRVEAFLDAAGARIVPIDAQIARRAAGLRARHRSLRLPDALSLATALVHGAELLSLDRRLTRVARGATGGG